MKTTDTFFPPVNMIVASTIFVLCGTLVSLMCGCCKRKKRRKEAAHLYTVDTKPNEKAFPVEVVDPAAVASEEKKKSKKSAMLDTSKNSGNLYLTGKQPDDQEKGDEKKPKVTEIYLPTVYKAPEGKFDKDGHYEPYSVHSVSPLYSARSPQSAPKIDDHATTIPFRKEKSRKEARPPEEAIAIHSETTKKKADRKTLGKKGEKKKRNVNSIYLHPTVYKVPEGKFDKDKPYEPYSMYSFGPLANGQVHQSAAN